MVFNVYYFIQILSFFFANALLVPNVSMCFVSFWQKDGTFTQSSKLIR